jgi:hypothetical protein
MIKMEEEKGQTMVCNLSKISPRFVISRLDPFHAVLILLSFRILCIQGMDSSKCLARIGNPKLSIKSAWSTDAADFRCMHTSHSTVIRPGSLPIWPGKREARYR